MTRVSAFIAIFLLILTPTRVLAHAALAHAEPAVGSTIAKAPADVTLHFSEDVVAPLSSIVVQNAAGQNVATAKASGGGATLHVPLAGHLPPGRYTVIWHAVSTDTHKTQGRFAFTVAP